MMGIVSKRRLWQASGKANKYNAKRVGGFDSGVEQLYDGMLKLLLLAGEIEDFDHHGHMVTFQDGRRYTPDFWVHHYVCEYFVEVKGPPTRKLADFRGKLATYRFEQRTFKKLPPLIVVEKAGPMRFVIVETVDENGQAAELLQRNGFLLRSK